MINRVITRLYDKKIDGSGIAVFRVLFSLVMLCEVIQLFYFRHLIFDKVPFLEPSEMDVTIPILLWMASLLFIAVGLFSRVTSIINYLFCLIFISTIVTYEYHMFYVYIGVSFLFMFLPISKVGSLDRLRLKLKHSNTRITYEPPKTTSVLNYLAFVFVGIAIVYFDSIFQKMESRFWVQGLGMWAPVSLPQTTLLDKTNFILNSKWASMLLGYLTLVFEFILIFTFYRKKWRVPLLIIGMGLHIGILLVFPIPWFGLGVCALYTLMIPVKYWKCLKEKVKLKNPKLTFYYDEECPLCNRTKIILTHLDFFNAIDFKGVQTYGFEEPMLKEVDRGSLLENIYSVSGKNKIYSGIDTYKYAFKRIPALFPLGVIISIPGIYHFSKWIYQKIAQNRLVDRCTEENCGFKPLELPNSTDDIKLTKNITVKELKVGCIRLLLATFILLQVNCIYNSLFFKRIKNNYEISNTKTIKYIDKASVAVQKISKIFLGITPHGVFVDSHFNGYEHIVRVDARLQNGKVVTLPIIDKNGNPFGYSYSFIWAKWTFRVNNPNIVQKRLEKGIRDFTSFWAHKENIDLNQTEFRILVKKVKVPERWEKDYLTKQIQKPWLDAGTVSWKNERFKSNIKVIEKM